MLVRTCPRWAQLAAGSLPGKACSFATHFCTNSAIRKLHTSLKNVIYRCDDDQEATLKLLYIEKKPKTNHVMELQKRQFLVTNAILKGLKDSTSQTHRDTHGAWSSRRDGDRRSQVGKRDKRIWESQRDLGSGEKDNSSTHSCRVSPALK